MMTKSLLVFILFSLVTFSSDQSYRDGIYKGISRSIYTDEPYYAYSGITIENGKITRVEFFVRDSAKHELFDDNYERYFAGNDLYIKQCRNDRQGIKSYPDSLLKYQDLDRVDVISGATWSYNLFKASCQEALIEAVNPK